MRIMTPKAGNGNAVPPEIADARLEAFQDWLKALDARDWKRGLEATRQLRALSISICLVTPPGDRRGA